MPLQKQNIPISFQQGLDTKTDPYQVIPGKFLTLQNCVFGEGMSLNKRNGYQNIATISTSAAENCATFKNELVGFTQTNLYSYSQAGMNVINKGSITGINVQINSVYRSSTQQITQDSAFHSAGYYLYVWIDSINGAQYQVVSVQTGNTIIRATSLVATAILPRAWAIGNFLLITYVDTSNNHLRYISIPIASLAPNAPTDISTQISASNPNYDGYVINNNFYIAWNGSDGGGAVRSTYYDQFLNPHTTLIQVGVNANSCITVFNDPTNATQAIYIAFCDGSSIKYYCVNLINQQTLAVTIAVTGLSNILNISGWALNNNGFIYYQQQNTYSYSTTRTDFVSQVAISCTGSVGSNTVFLRSVGLISKWININSNQYSVVSYAGHQQPTYFIVNNSGLIVGKIAYSNGGGYTTSSSLTTINAISSSQYQFVYLFKDNLETSQGTLFSNTGVNSCIFDFITNTIYNTTEAGSNLNITGGYLLSYDGNSPIENNFHLFPEDLGFSATSGTTGIFANTYGYSAVYEWTDNWGNIHQSAPSVPISVTLNGPTSGISINIPTLRLTSKQAPRANPVIALYRTAPSVATNIYYKVSSLTNPTYNNTAIDSVQITDTANDANIIGNQILYTTGGVIEDTGAPPASGTTFYKNRVFLIDAEDRNTLWYSKQVLEGTPVEMSDLFTLFVDPRFGQVTALAVMDDKLIVFKQSAIFYMTGDGPDNTGSNNDFSDFIFITSIVGCSNPKSIVFTQNGLMFQSDKGIWILDRGLGVNYIGAPVESFNAYLVTGAQIIPNTTQVRFTLSNGQALIYDYFYNIWGTFTNHSAVGNVIYQSLFTYLNSNGQFFQESPGVYTDAGNPFYMSFSTNWMSLSGLQGFQRAYRLYLKGTFISPHVLTVSVAYDFNPSNTQQSIIIPTQFYNPTYGSDPVYGSMQYYGGVALNEQYRINFQRQKCQNFQITVAEGIDTTNVVYGAALTIENLGLTIGQKSSYPRLSVNNLIS